MAMNNDLTPKMIAALNKIVDCKKSGYSARLSAWENSCAIHPNTFRALRARELVYKDGYTGDLIITEKGKDMLKALTPAPSPFFQPYLFGYAAYQEKRDLLCSWLSLHNALLVDIRLSPKSRYPAWRGDTLSFHLGEDYCHLKELGNKNYKGGAIEFLDPEKGFNRLVSLMQKRICVIMCMCGNPRHCHRSVVSGFLAAQCNITPIELTLDSVEELPRSLSLFQDGDL